MGILAPYGEGEGWEYTVFKGRKGGFDAAFVKLLCPLV